MSDSDSIDSDSDGDLKKVVQQERPSQLTYRSLCGHPEDGHLANKLPKTQGRFQRGNTQLNTNTAGATNSPRGSQKYHPQSSWQTKPYENGPTRPHSGQAQRPRAVLEGSYSGHAGATNFGNDGAHGSGDAGRSGTFNSDRRGGLAQVNTSGDNVRTCSDIGQIDDYRDKRGGSASGIDCAGDAKRSRASSGQFTSTGSSGCGAGPQSSALVGRPHLWYDNQKAENQDMFALVGRDRCHSASSGGFLDGKMRSPSGNSTQKGAGCSSRPSLKQSSFKRATGGNDSRHRDTEGNFQRMNPPPAGPGINSIPRKIIEWARLGNATCLVFDMSSTAHLLSSYLRSNRRIQVGSVSKLLSALDLVISSTSHQDAVDRILSCVLEADFLETHVHSFIISLPRGTLPHNDIRQSLYHLMNVLDYTVQNLPQFGSRCNRCIRLVVDRSQSLKGVFSDPALMLQASVLLTKSTEIEVQGHDANPSTGGKKPFRPFRLRPVPAPDLAAPPDDFRSISIFPDTEEIFDPVDPFLRANKTSGAYRDLQHYLDVHSRLLKEDYLNPIRVGLKSYKQALEAGESVKEADLRFYYHVKLIKMEPNDHSGVTHFAHFSTHGLKDLNWEHSQRLMFGCLVVLSKDQFETTIFATVSDRDCLKLKQGIVELTFQNNLEQVFTSSEFDVFTMAETKAYFESYRHVLEGLQEMQQLPLDRYILSCDPHVDPPSYLRNGVHLDISSIAQRGVRLTKIDALDEGHWPEAEDTVLNDSQLKAVKLALTHEMAIIQGPPGTGKTYVGLHITQILLKHAKRLLGRRPAPILVVCYTNHALDQFLEGMLPFCTSGIVRVGGQSSSEALKGLNLKNLRQNPHISRQIRRDITDNLKRCRETLKTVGNYISKYWQQSLKQETAILSIEDLEEEIPATHLRALTDPRRSNSLSPNVISVWLRATNANMENYLIRASRRHLASVIASGEGGLSDSSITSQLAATRAEFRTRVQIYQYWLGQYKQQQQELMEINLAGQKDGEEVYEKMEAASQAILPDTFLIPFMESEKVLEHITQSVKREFPSFNCSNNTVLQQWLLGRFKAADTLLDAIECLTKSDKPSTSRTSARNKNYTDDLDDNPRFQRVHWVLEDSSDDDTSQESGSEDDLDREDADHSNENDGEVCKEDFRKLKQEYEQLQNREIEIYQRALMLGVNMADAAADEEKEEDELQTAGALSHSNVFKLLHKVPACTEEEESEIQDVWSLEIRDRYRLYKYWVQQRKQKLTSRLVDLTREYREILAEKKKALEKKDAEILKSCKIIGMTTSGAAKQRAVLQKIGCRIVIVEEAAEVLEAHTVTSLNAKVEHLILIGDHRQLRPNPTVHMLAKFYGLEISLFERLVNNRIPRVTLGEQHRMRPEIAEYVRHIYTQLRDHSSVMTYEDIRGVTTNVFFLQHSFEEMEVTDSSSKSNRHEAEFLTALCGYFLQNNYESSQITILAAYSGQVAAIREAMEPEVSCYESVRVTSIDNYQGEENDIILLSLVRSNKENAVGFLETNNRVCVALSRAKKGLFVIGNMQQLASKNTLWQKILATASAQRATGMSLPLQCVNHPDYMTYVSSAEDIRLLAPSGGCNQPCGAVLRCGHICPLKCHSFDRDHIEHVCEQRCLRLCQKGHRCPQPCSEPCKPCQVSSVEVLPRCGHTDTVFCHEDVEAHICKQPCGIKMECGHDCRGECGKCYLTGSHLPCLEKVEKVWPACGHKALAACYKDPSIDPCEAKCKALLDCKHRCEGTCGGCLGGKVHKPCQKECGKPLPCGHPCKGDCGSACAPCGMKCPTRCRHGPCPRTTCGEPCEPCTENCALGCNHVACRRRCIDECSSPPCTRRCGRIVEPCKHKCVSICGEACVCLTCDRNKFSLIDTSAAKGRKPTLVKANNKFELTADTVLMKIPDCGHVFTLKQLDQYVQNADPQGSSYIRCPHCPGTIQNIRRYEAINKQRAERRHARKEKLTEDNKVNAEEVSRLIFAIGKIERFCDLDHARYLYTKDVFDNILPSEVRAFRLQIRLAYALLKLEDLDRELNKERLFNSAKWRNVLLAAHKSHRRIMTPQFYQEMRLELHRLLLSQQLITLSRLTKAAGLDLGEEVKIRLTAMKVSCKEKLDTPNLVTHQATVSQVVKKLAETGYGWEDLVNRMRSKVQLITDVVDTAEDQDLCTILDQNPSESCTSSESDGESDSEDDYVDYVDASEYDTGSASNETSDETSEP